MDVTQFNWVSISIYLVINVAIKLGHKNCAMCTNMSRKIIRLMNTVIWMYQCVSHVIMWRHVYAAPGVAKGSDSSRQEWSKMIPSDQLAVLSCNMCLTNRRWISHLDFRYPAKNPLELILRKPEVLNSFVFAGILEGFHYWVMRFFNSLRWTSTTLFRVAALQTLMCVHLKPPHNIPRFFKITQHPVNTCLPEAKRIVQISHT